MSEENKEKKISSGNKNINKEVNTSQQPSNSGSELTEVKNANASGVGSMRRHDEESENQEGTLQKD